MNRGHAELLNIVSGTRTGLIADSIRLVLFLLSAFYRVAIQIRNWSFDSGLRRIHQVQAPVISIGNLTTGGTGKTPLVIWLADRLSKTHDVAVVSRGYGSSGKALNDEGLELRQRVPAIVQVQHPDRVAAAKQALAQLADRCDTSPLKPVIVLDDGFQHRRLHRDLNIVLIDAVNPLGHGHLIPRGLLREPVDSIKRADIAVLTRANLVTEAERDCIRKVITNQHPAIGWMETELASTGWLDHNRQLLPLQDMANKRLLAFSGIGNPEGFLRTLEQLRLTPVDSMIFRDHHSFSAVDIVNICERAQRANCDAVACTGKDLVKLNGWPGGLPLVALQTEVRITDGANILDRALDELAATVTQHMVTAPLNSVAAAPA